MATAPLTHAQGQRNISARRCPLLIPLSIVTAAAECAAVLSPRNLVVLEAAIAAHRNETECAKATPRDLLVRSVIGALPPCFHTFPHGADTHALRRSAFMQLHALLLALTNTYRDGECEESVVRLSQGLDSLARHMLGHSLPWKNHILMPA